jgi:hypothetical protein
LRGRPGRLILRHVQDEGAFLYISKIYGLILSLSKDEAAPRDPLPNASRARGG